MNNNALRQYDGSMHGTGVLQCSTVHLPLFKSITTRVFNRHIEHLKSVDTCVLELILSVSYSL